MATNLQDTGELQEKISRFGEDKYSIYNYFKEHTAFAVTCMSALVAVMSFVFNYAINLFNSAYLQYWNIDALYAIQNAKGQFYTVFMAFVFYVVLFGVHALMSNTADAYCECYRFIYVCRKRLRRSDKELKEQKKRILKQKKLIKKHEGCPDIDELQSELKEIEQENANIKEGIKELKEEVSAYNRLLLHKVAGSIVVSIVIGVLASVLLYLNALEDGWGKILLLSLLIVVPTILLDLGIYFLPAIVSVRRKYSKVEDMEAALEELNAHEEEEAFPLEKIVTSGARSFVTNTNIKFVLSQIVIVSLVLLVTFTYLGRNSAQRKDEFPIFSDGDAVYAIIYNNGESIVMERAEIEEDSITVDTSEQRVIPASTISFTLREFNDVTVLR